MSNLVPIKPVKSSAIRGLGYHPETQTLAIQFAGGALHHFRDVPPDAAAALENAESMGRHFADHIRDKFDSEPVQSQGA